MKDPRKAAASTLAVVVGAMLGACILYCALGGWSGAYESLHHLWELLPGYRPKMVDVVSGHLSSGARGLISGPSSGIPYRVYVLEAWNQGIPLVDVLLWTPVARLERIVIAPIVVLLLRFGARKLLLPRFTQVPWERAIAGLIVIYWIALYVWYWGVLVPKLYG
jgi:hypothetical protein